MAITLRARSTRSPHAEREEYYGHHAEREEYAEPSRGA